MKNREYTELLRLMLGKYNRLAYTHEYLLGISYKGNIYVIHCQAEDLLPVVKLDKASRGAGYALRFRPTRAQKELLMSMGDKMLLCSKDFFDSTVKNSQYNKGEILEKMLTEFFGQKWVKDSVPFTKAGDIEVDGIAYQIKFENATFTNEKILARL